MDVDVPAADELRPVTVLFADLVGSTSLGERLALDEVKALVGECVSRMAACVEQYGGVVALVGLRRDGPVLDALLVHPLLRRVAAALVDLAFAHARVVAVLVDAQTQGTSKR